jgi:hypothetical protein
MKIPGISLVLSTTLAIILLASGAESSNNVTADVEAIQRIPKCGVSILLM